MRWISTASTKVKKQTFVELDIELVLDDCFCGKVVLVELREDDITQKRGTDERI